MSEQKINRRVLLVFAPVLILVGLAAFLLPAEQSPTSAAPSYAVFHLIFGGVGLAALATKQERWARLFNLGFGLIDLYQAVASRLDLFPERFFRWTVVDDILHVVIGLILVGVALYGAAKRR